jgi:hypothetical protein
MGLIEREIHEGGERCSGEDLVGGPLKHPLSWKQFGSLEVAGAEDCMHSPQCQKTRDRDGSCLVGCAHDRNKISKERAKIMPKRDSSYGGKKNSSWKVLLLGEGG